jgi:hypothetical protein
MKLPQPSEPVLKTSGRLAQDALDLGSLLAGRDQRPARPGPCRLGAVMTNDELLKSNIVENSDGFTRPDRLAKLVCYCLSALA